MIALARIRKATAPKFPPLSSQERAIRNAILAATDRIASATTLAEVRAALDANDVDAAVEAIRVDQGEAFLRSILPQQFRAAYEIVGGATALETSKMLGIGYSFDILTPSAVDWVRQNAGSLIRQWGDSSRDALAKVIADGFRNRVPAATLARRVLDTGIGLTWRQARAVLNMRHRLERDGVAADVVQGRAERYFKRLLRDRAEMIARTEITRAAVHARLESWRQAAAQGLLDPTRLEMEWLATGDARVCPDCADLDGTRAKAPDGHFLSDSGTDGGVGPPFHPRCRCRLVLVPVGSQKMPRARVNRSGDTGRRPRRP